MEHEFTGLAKVEDCARYRPCREADASLVLPVDDSGKLFVEHLGNQFSLARETTVLLWVKDGRSVADSYEREQVSRGVVLYLDDCDYYEVWQAGQIQECWSGRVHP